MPTGLKILVSGVRFSVCPLNQANDLRRMGVSSKPRKRTLERTLESQSGRMMQGKHDGLGSEAAVLRIARRLVSLARRAENPAGKVSEHRRGREGGKGGMAPPRS